MVKSTHAQQGSAPGVPYMGWRWVREGFTTEVTQSWMKSGFPQANASMRSGAGESIPGQPRGQCMQSHWDVRTPGFQEQRGKFSVQLGHSLGRWERRWNSQITACNHLAEEYDSMLAYESVLVNDTSGMIKKTPSENDLLAWKNIRQAVGQVLLAMKLGSLGWTCTHCCI